MTRLRQAVLLLPSLPRATRWVPIPLSALVGVGLLELWGPGTLGFRFAALVICLGTAFVLEDDAVATVASVPSPLLFRRTVRLAFALSLVAVSWAALLWYGNAVEHSRPTLELVAMVAVTLGVAASFDGVAAASALLALFGAAWLLPEGLSLFADGAAAGRRWWLVVALGVAGVLCGSRDPGRRRLGARIRPSPQRSASTKEGAGQPSR